MKILILANNDVGLYQFRSELIGRLLERGDVTISLPYGALVEPLKEAGCRFADTPFDRRGLNPVRDLELTGRYLGLIRKEKPDLVITYTIKPNIYGGMVCRLLGVPYAVNITGLGTAFQNRGLLRALVTMLYKAALKKAKVVFFENSANRQVFLDLGIVTEKQACLLNGAGVNLQKYSPAPYPVEEGPVRFLFIGRVMKEKGIDELFEVMERLSGEGMDCCLDVLGGYEEDYAEAMQRYEKAGWLRYHGYQQDVRPFIRQAHCFVLPSYHEGMANTNLECAAMARPVITSRIPGCMEAVEEGVSGLLCEARDADSLYGAMKAFLALPREEKVRMGAEGRKRMENLFDKRVVVEKTVKELGH